MRHGGSGVVTGDLQDECLASRVHAKLLFDDPKWAPYFEPFLAPDLGTINDFFRFQIAISRGKVDEKPTFDSVNGYVKWLLPASNAFTGTRIADEDGKEVYNVGALPYGTWRIQPHNH